MTLDEMITALNNLKDSGTPGATPVLRHMEVNFGGEPVDKTLADIYAPPQQIIASGHTCGTWISDCSVEDMHQCPDGKYLDAREPERVDVWVAVVI